MPDMREDPPAIDWTRLNSTLRPENNAGFLLWQVSNLWQRSIRERLEPLGLTYVQYLLLSGLTWLREREDSVNQARLAQFCKTDPMMTSQVLRALERAGLIRRRRDDADNRARALDVTRAGIATLNKALVERAAAERDFFGADGSRAVEALRAVWLRNKGPEGMRAGPAP